MDNFVVLVLVWVKGELVFENGYLGEYVDELVKMVFGECLDLLQLFDVEVLVVVCELGYWV